MRSATPRSATPRYGGTLRYFGPGGLDRLDPATAYYAFSHQIVRLFARQLFSYPSTVDTSALTPVPDVAARTPTARNGGVSADGHRVTIHLRGAVRWDTTPERDVTAADFVRGFKRMCNPVAGAGALAYYTSTIAGMAEFAAGYHERFAGTEPTAEALAGYQNSNEIAGLRAVDDRTLVIELLRPANDLLNILAMTFASAAPREFDEYLPDSPELRRNLRANGPYRLRAYRPGERLTMARNPAWRQGADPIRRQYVERIDVRIARVGEEEIRRALHRDEADLSWGAPVVSPHPPVDADRHVGYALNPYLVFNLHSPNEGGAMRDVRVRRAVAYAVDKAALVTFFDGMDAGTVTQPAHTLIPPGNVGYREYDPYPTPGDRGDPARSRRLLDEAGYPSGLVVRLLYREDAVHAEVAAAIAANLSEGGFTVAPVLASQSDEYYRVLQDPARARAGEWDLTAPAWTPDWFGNNGRTLLQPLLQSRFSVGTANYGGYQNPAVDALIDKALAAAHPHQADQLWHEVDRLALEDAAIVPILVCEPTIAHMTSVRVRNAIPLPHVDRWYDAANLWLDPPD